MTTPIIDYQKCTRKALPGKAFALNWLRSECKHSFTEGGYTPPYAERQLTQPSKSSYLAAFLLPPKNWVRSRNFNSHKGGIAEKVIQRMIDLKTRDLFQRKGRQPLQWCRPPKDWLRLFSFIYSPDEE